MLTSSTAKNKHKGKKEKAFSVLLVRGGRGPLPFDPLFFLFLFFFFLFYTRYFPSVSQSCFILTKYASRHIISHCAMRKKTETILRYLLPVSLLRALQKNIVLKHIYSSNFFLEWSDLSLLNTNLTRTRTLASGKLQIPKCRSMS